MRSIGSRAILLVSCVVVAAACGGDPGAPAPGAGEAPDAPSAPSSPPASPPPPPPPGAADTGGPSAPPCAAPPCAARPIVFVHGFTGSNDDFVPTLDKLSSDDPRWSGYQSVGRAEHQEWVRRAFDRKRWLFAFDYYLDKAKDGRGAYSAGPGRIGTNAADACGAPHGDGDIVADHEDAYDAGVTHSYAQDLSEMIDDVLFATGSPKVDIVAHSMGGMIARSYLAFFGGNARVERMLLLASPVEGVAIDGLLEYFPVSHPSWMNDHEVAELDGGSFVSKIRFTLCGGASSGAFGTQLLAREKAHPPGPELYVMSGASDPLISYASADHPLARAHDVVPGADHSGILKAQMTVDHVRAVVGGTE